MKTKAALAVESGQPLVIEELDLDGPKEGEVLVEVKATGVCHTDAFTLSGDDPEGIFPAVLGHEGAGVVVETGPGVKSVAAGDHVILLYTPECRECEFCLNPKTNLCQSIRETQGQDSCQMEHLDFPSMASRSITTWVVRLFLTIQSYQKLLWLKLGKMHLLIKSVTSPVE